MEHFSKSDNNLITIMKKLSLVVFFLSFIGIILFSCTFSIKNIYATVSNIDVQKIATVLYSKYLEYTVGNDQRKDTPEIVAMQNQFEIL
jgi:hypothetical protein